MGCKPLQKLSKKLFFKFIPNENKIHKKDLFLYNAEKKQSLKKWQTQITNKTFDSERTENMYKKNLQNIYKKLMH